VQIFFRFSRLTLPMELLNRELSLMHFLRNSSAGYSGLSIPLNISVIEPFLDSVFRVDIVASGMLDSFALS
jgi:hypothetical protein